MLATKSLDQATDIRWYEANGFVDKVKYYWKLSVIYIKTIEVSDYLT